MFPHRERINNISQRALRDTLPTSKAHPHVQHARGQRPRARQVKPPVEQRPRDALDGPRHPRHLPHRIAALPLQGLEISRDGRVLRARGPLEPRREGYPGEGAQVGVGRVGEDDAARRTSTAGGGDPGGLAGEPALPQRQVQRRQLGARGDLDVLDLDDGAARARAARVLKVRRERVGLAAGREVRARRGEHARGCVAAVGDWGGEMSWWLLEIMGIGWVGWCGKYRCRRRRRRRARHCTCASLAS